MSYVKLFICLFISFYYFVLLLFEWIENKDWIELNWTWLETLICSPGTENFNQSAKRQYQFVTIFLTEHDA